MYTSFCSHVDVSVILSFHIEATCPTQLRMAKPAALFSIEYSPFRLTPRLYMSYFIFHFPFSFLLYSQLGHTYRWKVMYEQIFSWQSRRNDELPKADVIVIFTSQVMALLSLFNALTPYELQTEDMQINRQVPQIHDTNLPLTQPPFVWSYFQVNLSHT